MDYLMTKYTVKSDMHLGEQVNDIGVRKAVKVTRGQIVEGNVITRFVFNKNTKGKAGLLMVWTSFLFH
jgi:hypothetical protein